MGMGEEMLQQMESDYMAEMDFRQSLAKEIVENYKMGCCLWTQKNEEKILIQDIANDHLKNIIKFLNKKPYEELSSITVNAWRRVMRAEETKRKYKKG